MNRTDDKFPAHKGRRGERILGQRLPDFMVTDSAVLKELGDSVIKANMIADGSLGVRKAIQPPHDNLIPNGYSEAGQTALTAGGLEALNLVNDPANAYEGDWCRKWTLAVAGAQEWHPADYLPCKEGDQFFVSFKVKTSRALGSTSLHLALGFYDKNKTWMAATDSPSGGVATSYVDLSVTSAKAPAGAVYFSPYLYISAAGGDVGADIFIDMMDCRKCLVAPMIQAATIQTSDFQEDTSYTFPDGTHPASKGGKLDNTVPGAAVLRVDGNGICIGRYTINDAFLRAANALSGTSSTGRYFYKGNCDTGTRGGLPNPNSVIIKHNDGGFTGVSGLSYGNWVLQVVRSNLNDNLDGLCWANVHLYMVDGTNTNAISVAYIQVPLSDPSYTLNEFDAEFRYMSSYYNFSGCSDVTATYHTHFLVKLCNHYGWSDEIWHHCANRYAAYTKDTTPPGNAPAPTTGGTGSDPGGGYCPEEHEPILLADGTECPAGRIRPGDWVLTQHADTLAVGRYLVQSVKLARARDLLAVVLKDGRRLVNSKGHRFHVMGRGWLANNQLRPGDRLDGAAPDTVERIEDVGSGYVVKLSVDGAQTFEQRGVLSHNAKQL